jgi:hypothetical protein
MRIGRRFPSLRRLLHYPPILRRCPGFQELRACGKRFVVCAVRFIPLLYFTKDLGPDTGCWQAHLAVVDTVWKCSISIALCRKLSQILKTPSRRHLV